LKPIVAVSLLITIVFTYLAYHNPGVIDGHIENLLVDYRFKVRNMISPPEVPDDILIVAIDEKSLSEYGRWPWGRKRQAELVEKVFEGKPVVVALDIFFPESESAEADRALAEVMSAHKERLISALGFEVEEGRVFQGEVDDVLYENAVMQLRDQKMLKPVKSFNVLMPPEVIAASSVFGHVYALPDMDGKLRWETLYIQYADEYFASLAVKASAIAMGKDPEKVSIVGGRGVDLNGSFIPSDAFGRLQINYSGKENTFPYISASDVLSGNVSAHTFDGKIVLIGTSAVATYDSKITPFSANMPGVEKNAAVIANIISGDFMGKSPHYFDVFIVLLTGVAALLMSSKKKASRTIIFYASFVVLILILNQAAFTYFNIRVNLTYPLLTVIVIATCVISHRYFVEEKSAREIRKMFSSYVTERVVNELIANPDMAKVGGARREVTVLFSDICGFTIFSEEHDPEHVVEMLNEYLTVMTDIVFRWEGRLDKFIGDAIVAFWGAPLPQENHAELAVKCALNMIDRLEDLKKKWISEGKTPLSVGIGLNTGEVLVGNIGADGKKMDYTVIGDHVNLGARVESLTRKFETDILITEFTLRKIKEPVRSRRIGHVSIKGVGNIVVKGRKSAMKVYEMATLDPSVESMTVDCDNDDVIHLHEK
jgi:adenylate cyclase